ncbi:hypothetical protein BH24ACT19_BH24ACT19_17530 [soil metagenome]
MSLDNAPATACPTAAPGSSGENGIIGGKARTPDFDSSFGKGAS